MKIFFSSGLFFFSILLVSVFPLFSYRISMASDIFPRLDLVLIFCLCDRSKIGYLFLFLIGLLLDPIYSDYMGINSFGFISGKIMLDYLNEKICSRHYLANFGIFCLYALWIFYSSDILFNTDLVFREEILVPQVFQYILTIFSYPIIEFIIQKFDKKTFFKNL